MYISIHALVKRATDVVNNYIRVAGISIHALVKRATHFQWQKLVKILISIHALVKRATTPTNTPQSVDLFQSTPS